MKPKIQLTLLVFFSCLIGRSQKPEQLLDGWSAKSPIEKIYLHVDRDNYIAGETAWFKAYLSSDYQPDTISTSLYAELLNEQGSVLSRSISPILLGTSNGHFDLPDSLTTGAYLFRAYTPTMLNHDAGFIYKRSIFIYGKKNKTNEPVTTKMTRLEFFPEGGNFISNVSNTVAFKTTDEKGLPLDVKGSVINDKNEQVASFNSYHDGMGYFEMTPKPGEKYFAIVDGDAASKKYELPGQTTKGIALTIIPHPQGELFELKQRKDDPAFQVAYMIGQMQHHIVFRQDFKTVKEEMQGVINTQRLHSGILQVTFFNKEDQPLAERLCFVDNKEYIQQGELIMDTISFTEKGRNRISIQLKDTVQGSFSVSIIDPDYQLFPHREENIYTSLLLTSDLKGYVHDPAYYFSSGNDSVKTALDMVMMTNGWRRFKWTDLTSNPPANYKDASFITLNGKITLRDSKKPFAGKPMLLMLIMADSTRKIQMISTNKEGQFRLDSMLFFGQSSVFLSDIRGKKNEFIDIHFAADSLARFFQLPSIGKMPFAMPEPAMIGNHSKTDIDYDAIARAKGITLETVTVKTKKKNPLEELEEKYTSGRFSGGDHKTFDLVNNKDADHYNTIFDYLRTQIPSLAVVDDNNDPADASQSSGSRIKIYYRQPMTTGSSLGPIPMTIYMDEVQTDADVVATIPANQVAMVKLFSSFVGATGNGAGGVLAIYTRKGSDMYDVMQHSADMEKYNGYTVIKEFYEPDYKVDKAAMNKADNRITLCWRPGIFVNNIDPKIPVSFYNNDRTRSFRIVVEGMTLDGKMLMIEKTIGTKGF